MSLDKLMLILVCVLAALGASFWVATMLLAALQVPYGWLALLPTALVGYIAWRVIQERITNKEDDHYDGIEH